MSVESELADYKKLLSETSPVLLRWSQELDNLLIPMGITHSAAKELRIVAAQFAGAGARGIPTVP
jgi:hypothetical protein